MDLERVLGSKRDVLIGIPLGINNGSRTRRLVSDHVRGVRQTREIELLKDQIRTSACRWYPGVAPASGIVFRFSRAG
jgi:hypothetical protein